MLRSLLKGVGLGTGMGLGQELAGNLLENIRGKKGGYSASERDIQCDRCGQINTSDSKFCGECGSPVVTRCILKSGVKCACGFMNVQGQKFCSECGNQLT